MAEMYLGRFLVKMGMVSQQAVNQAVARQRASHLRLGQRAIRAGYMTEQQVQQVHYHQQSDDRMFGEIAIALDMLTEAQLNLLRNQQDQARVRLGQALVEAGALTEPQLTSALQSYEAYQRERHHQIANAIASTPHAIVLHALVHTSRLAFPRFGIAQCKVAEVRIFPRATEGIRWSAFVGMMGSYRIAFGIGLSQSAADALLRHAPRQNNQAQAPTHREAIALLVHTIAHHARSSMPGTPIGIHAVVAEEGDGFKFMEALIAERHFTQLRLSLSVTGQPITTGVLTVATLRDDS